MTLHNPSTPATAMTVDRSKMKNASGNGLSSSCTPFTLSSVFLKHGAAFCDDDAKPMPPVKIKSVQGQEDGILMTPTQLQLASALDKKLCIQLPTLASLNEKDQELAQGNLFTTPKTNTNANNSKRMQLRPRRDMHHKKAQSMDSHRHSWMQRKGPNRNNEISRKAASGNLAGEVLSQSFPESILCPSITSLSDDNGIENIAKLRSMRYRPKLSRRLPPKPTFRKHTETFRTKRKPSGPIFMPLI